MPPPPQPLEFHTCQNQLFIDIKKRMKMSHVCGMWLLEISPRCLCVQACMCVYLASDVLQESVLMSSGARGRLTLEHPALLSAAYGEMRRERTHKQNWAKQPVILMKCLCMGRLYVFYSSMIALGSRLFFLHVFVSVLLYRGERGSGKHSGLILSQGTTPAAGERPVWNSNRVLQMR